MNNQDKKVCLIVLFNHKFEKNIDKLEDIYKARFSYRYYVMPFYQGDNPRVIPVYECSYQFQGYITQAFPKIYNECFDHYFVVADDMIINPAINENNFWDFFRLGPEDAYITNIRPYSQWDGGFDRVHNAIDGYFRHPGMVHQGSLIDADEAFAIAKSVGYEDFTLPSKLLFNGGIRYAFKFWLKDRTRFKQFVIYWASLNIRKRGLPFPFMWGYSDIFAISKNGMKNFCHWCGVMAAMRIHVETAIPTTIMLTHCNVVTNDKLAYTSKIMWDRKERQVLGNEADWSVDKLVKNWDDNLVCVHPIKLSEWN